MLAVVASVAVGIGMFGTTVFLSQYMQIARGMSPTAAGLLSIPMVVGLFLASTFIGRLVTRTGRYKRFMLLGTLLMTAGLALMGTMDERTSLIEIGAFMLVLGAGLGMVMQNLAQVIEHAYGTGIAEIFLLAAPLGLVAFVALLFVREAPLGSKSGIELAAEPRAAPS